MGGPSTAKKLLLLSAHARACALLLANVAWQSKSTEMLTTPSPLILTRQPAPRLESRIRKIGST